MKEKYFEGTQNISCFPRGSPPPPMYCKEFSLKTFKYKCQIVTTKDAEGQ